MQLGLSFIYQNVIGIHMSVCLHSVMNLFIQMQENGKRVEKAGPLSKWNVHACKKQNIVLKQKFRKEQIHYSLRMSLNIDMMLRPASAVNDAYRNDSSFDVSDFSHDITMVRG